jgi:hypothetical protein
MRLWFPCHVLQVGVERGQTVRKGDRVMAVRIDEMGAAKAHMRKAAEEYNQTKKALDELSRDKAGVVDTKKKSELERALADLSERTRKDIDLLSSYDRHDGIWRMESNAQDESRVDVICGIDGIVTRVVAEPGTDYNENRVLIVVESTPEGKVQGAGAPRR